MTDNIEEYTLDEIEIEVYDIEENISDEIEIEVCDIEENISDEIEIEVCDIEENISDEIEIEIEETKIEETKIEETKIEEDNVKNANKQKNRGTGAGGSNTNYHVKKFEDKTNNYFRLLEIGYEEKSLIKKPNKMAHYYLIKNFEDRKIIFVLQNGLKMYMKNYYNIDLFRCPDEAYIIEYFSGKKILKILEKKEQNVEGSVETKLWSCPSLKREYEICVGSNFEIAYGLSVSNFLKEKILSNDKKYIILNKILNENNIPVLFGNDYNYFEILDNWIMN